MNVEVWGRILVLSLLVFKPPSEAVCLDGPPTQTRPQASNLVVIVMCVQFLFFYFLFFIFYLFAIHLKC